MITPRKTPSTSGDVSAHYDELDAFYRDIWGDHLHHGLWVTGRESQPVAVRQLVDFVAAEAEIGAGQRVIDIGSGYGAAARYAALEYGAHVTAITLSPAQHAAACRSSQPEGNPTYLLGDFLEYDLPERHFDAAYAIESASHMRDPAALVGKAVRLLRPGGCLVLCAWTASEGTGRIATRHLLEPICREGRLAHLSTAAEYVDAIERAGADLTEFRDLAGSVRRTWTMALRRTLVRLPQRPDMLRYLLRSSSGERIFLLTMLRIWAAYRVGAMRYCLFKARRPKGLEDAVILT